MAKQPRRKDDAPKAPISTTMRWPWEEYKVLKEKALNERTNIQQIVLALVRRELMGGKG